ncbi:TPA: GDSL-type esterase/lipase family protein [Streptococcus suis]
MEPICLIPARSGSKGLQNKNMLFLDGKPMIFHTIQAAIDSGCFKKENIYVSTDSFIYKEICETTGVKVLMRPEELATDFTTSFQLNEHFLKDFSDNQVFVLLQVTSPLRTGVHVREAMELYETSNADHVVSFTKVDKSPTLFSTLDEDGFASDITGLGGSYRRQDEKKLYYPNGAIYISSKKPYLSDKTYFSDKTKAYLMSKEDSIDVDDRNDFMGVIGRIYFNYKRREEQSKASYKESYYQVISKRTQSNIILGDSRLLSLEIPMFDNFSIGGVTVATLLENITYILDDSLNTVLISLGINDLITQYPMSEIKENFKQLVTKVSTYSQNLLVTTIPFSLFRESVSNQDISELNEYIYQLSEELGFDFLDLNHLVSKNGMLDYKYTSDGLHFNSEGQEKINQFLKEKLSF